MPSTSSPSPTSPRGQEPRNAWQSIKRGFIGLCPRCGNGEMFRAYLKVNDLCPFCGEELYHQRADDAPAYLTIVVVGHIVVGLMLWVETNYGNAPIWLHFALWPALTLVLSLVLLPRIKGALIAFQWALRMHGFESAASAETTSMRNRAE